MKDAEREVGNDMFTQKFMQEIERSFEAQLNRLGERRTEVEAALVKCSNDEAEALKCLYASMPVSDAADYEAELFLSYAKHGVFLWEAGPFAGTIPEEIFAGYILHHRVNNEDLTPCRPFFYEKLHKRIEGLSMAKAILEINYWCAEEATYRTTDDRTASAECVYRSAYGRCGEESTFAVSVFRSVGIPARQVYVPLWSHCDDNHAWVEVWSDGTWKFLGACEPEEVLNKGWFTNASSRAMMVHSRWLLPVRPKEEQVGRTGMALVANQLKTYAKTTTVEVTVLNVDSTPASGAEIRFGVLNYAEFGEIACARADAKGKKVLETGFGTLQVTAYKDGAYAEQLVDVAERHSCILRLGQTACQPDVWTEMIVIAPKDSPVNRCVQSEEEILFGREKSRKATKKRMAKEAAFYDEDVAVKAAECMPERFRARAVEIMKLACGNQREIAKFLEKEMEPALKMELLNSLREKDYLDITADSLEEHCRQAAVFAGKWDKELFVPYILCPRVDNEMIRPFRRFLLSWLSEKERQKMAEEPKYVWEFVCAHLKSDEQLEYGNLITSAQGAFTTGYGSALTKRVVSVQILRTLGIPARLNPSDQILEVWKDGAFVALEEYEGQSEVRTAGIVVEQQEGKTWTYYQNWPIAKFDGTKYQTLRLSDESGLPVYGEIPLFPGQYKILTANRLPNGNVFAKQFVFVLKEGEKRHIVLEQKEADVKDMLEENAITDFTVQKEDGTQCHLSELVKEKEGLFLWLEEGKEPTEHLLNEIRQRSEAYNQLLANLYFVVRDMEVKKDPTLAKTLAELEHAQFLVDDFGVDMETLARRMYLEPGKLPLIVIVDQEMRGIYGVAGYNVGSADMILKILNR